ncbi:MAG TPA: hypothetical protein VKR58_00525 [Aquella sp.]|nr:hypothetical protein [Aquella sp.]
MKKPSPGNQGGNPNSPEKVSIVGKVLVEYDPKGVNDISNAIRDQTSAQQNAGNASDGISNTGIQQQRRANNIAFGGLIASVISIIATIVIIVLNYKAIDAAKESATTANNTLKEQREEFNRINEPTLDVVDVTLAFAYSKVISFDLFIKNLGTHVVVGIGKTDTVIFVKKADVTKFMQDPFSCIDTNRLTTISEEYYSNYTKETQLGITQANDSLYRGFLAKELSAFIVKYTLYNSLVNDKRRVYKCIIEMFPMDQILNKKQPGIRYATSRFNYILNRNYYLPN